MKTKTKDAPTLTHEEAWRVLPALPEYAWHLLRIQAEARLVESLRGSGQGISSSDINHEVVAILTSGESDLGIKTLRHYLPLKKN